MKQYTTPEQTAQLIELGFERPQGYAEGECYSDIYPAYSIGELIEMLPLLQTDADNEDWPLSIEAGCNLEYSSWFVYYVPENIVEKPELIDALYEMIVKLKEEKII